MIGTERVTSRSSKNDTAAREGEGGRELGSPDFSRNLYQSLVMKVAGKAMMFFILKTGGKKMLLWAKGVAANGEVARILHYCDYLSSTLNVQRNRRQTT
jgi:hypothetical protein